MFFSSSSLARGPWWAVGRSGLPHVAEPTRNGPSHGALPDIYLAAAKGRNGRGSGRYAGLGERKSHFRSDFSHAVFDGLR